MHLRNRVTDTSNGTNVRAEISKFERFYFLLRVVAFEKWGFFFNFVESTIFVAESIAFDTANS